jgi:hypothetical protein
MSTIPHTGSARFLQQVDEFLTNKSPVQDTLRKLAGRLLEEKIPYALIGGMALALYGFVRPTEDVDILLSQEGLQDFHERLAGRGYVPVFPGAKKHFRDAETGIKVEIITSGEYPGDGKPKPVAFPLPSDAVTMVDDFSVMSLEKLIELKLASGLSAEHRRLRDLADVQQLIETINLSRELGSKLDDSVKDEYEHLWLLAQRSTEEANEDEESLSNRKI